MTRPSTSSVMTSGSSQTTRPPSEVTPARRLLFTDMSLTAVAGAKRDGSVRRVLSPLEREMTRTRPLVIAYATH